MRRFDYIVYIVAFLISAVAHAAFFFGTEDLGEDEEDVRRKPVEVVIIDNTPLPPPPEPEPVDLTKEKPKPKKIEAPPSVTEKAPPPKPDAPPRSPLHTAA